MQRTYILLVVVVLGVSAAWSAVNPPTQPTTSQLNRAVRSIKKDSRCPNPVTFVAASPADPEKHPLSDVAPIDRIRFTLRDPVARRVYEVFTETNSGKVNEWRRLDDVEPVLTSADRDSASMIMWRHAAFLKSLERRGIDSSDVYLDLWPSQIPRTGFRFRNARVVAYHKGQYGAEDYTRPIEGLVATVNLDARRVFEFHDKEPGPVLPLVNDAWKQWRAQKKQTMKSVAPTSRIVIRKGEIRWRDWRVSPRLHADEGLVLYDVEMDVEGGRHSVAHRLSVGEIAEIHGDKGQYWYWRHPLLVGEYGLGASVVEQDRGIDMPRYVQTMSVAHVSPTGGVRSVPDAIACYESNNALVIKSTFRLGHREITQHYHLLADGTITANVTVGGILPVKSVPDSIAVFDDATPQKFGRLVAPYRLAPHRQYVACFRMDMDVDGDRNLLSEVDIRTPHETENTFHQLFEMDDYPFYREREAVRDQAPEFQRTWKVSSTEHTNTFYESAYRIVPGHNDPSIINGTHVMRSKAPFIDHTLMVTRQHDAERLPSGEYPNQTVGGSGLPVYVRNNESIRGQDLVVWYTAVATHVPKPEDWPVMQPLTLSVRLEPDGFVVPRSPQPSR